MKKRVASMLERTLDAFDRHPVVAIVVMAVVVSTTTATVFGLRCALTDRPASLERYERVTAVIDSEPRYEKNGDGTITQARVEVRSGAHRGAHAVVGVDEQAAEGMEHTAYVDTTTGRLWRTDTAGNDPYDSVAEAAAVGAAVGVFASIAFTGLAMALVLVADSLSDPLTHLWELAHGRRLRHR